MKLKRPVVTEDGTGLIFDLNTANRIQFVLTVCVPEWKKLINNQDKKINLLIDNVRSATTALDIEKEITADTLKWGKFWKDQWEDATEENWFEFIFGSNEFWLLLGISIGAGAVAIAESGNN